MSRRVVFLGVSTGESSVNRIFPRWRDVLGLGDVELAGRDLPRDAPPEAYRAQLASLRDGVVGMLVTVHKIDVLRHGRDLFDALDQHALRLGEVSCVGVRDGRLAGFAKDPLTATRALAALVPPGEFADGRHALIMGAGGSGAAIADCLLQRDDPPARIVLTDRDRARLERAGRLLGGRAELVEIDGDHDDLLAAQPPGTLVVNATGMGKDRPGSPLGDGAVFPERAVAWELNYRGDLQFLRQARAQLRERELIVEDGWRYFIENWAVNIEEVFQRPISSAEVEALSDAASFARPAISREEALL